MRDATEQSRPVVLIWYVTMLRHYVSALAGELRQRHGFDCVLLTYEPANLPHAGQFGFDPSAFREILFLGDCLTPDRSPPLAGAVGEAERQLGRSLVDLLRTDRELGRDFVLGAEFAEPARLTGLAWDARIGIALRFVARLREILRRLRPVAVLCGAGSIGPAALSALARNSGLPCRDLILARVDSRLCWAAGWEIAPVGLAAAFAESLRVTPAPPAQVDAAEEAHRQALAARPKQYEAWLARERGAGSLPNLAQRLGRIARKHASYRLRHRGKRHGRYTLASEVRHVWRLWLWLRASRREPALLPGLPAGLDYIYFPLHVEPESGVMVEAQAADNQLACIDWLAKNLPGDWRLVVKEHPALHAPRPPGFHARLKAYPNLLLAGTWESSETLAAGARAVATINGSTGIQAAVAGQPVISFNSTFHGNLMPHVMLARGYAETRAAIARIRDGELPDRTERRRAGAAFLHAVRASSFAVSDGALRDQLAGTQAIAAADAAILADRFVAACDLAPPPQVVPTMAAQ